MRQSEHAIRFCKLSSGEESEKKRMGEKRFPLNFSLVVTKFQPTNGGNGVLAHVASSRAPRSYQDGVSRVPSSTIALSLSVIPTL
jgi:hypothetical protein